jgi:polyribonucleotide nucleotidyltransferase
MGTVEIEGRNVGKIIGPRGATIKQLQDDYRVQISISKEDNEVSFFEKKIVKLAKIYTKSKCFRMETESPT